MLDRGFERAKEAKMEILKRGRKEKGPVLVPTSANNMFPLML